MVDEDADQYQKRMRKRVAEALKEVQMEQQKKEIMRRFLDSAAYEQHDECQSLEPGALRPAHQPDSLAGAEQQSDWQANRSQLKSLVERITYKKEPTISFKHK